MFEGVAEIASRVAEIEAKLGVTGSARHAAQESFAKTLQQTQASGAPPAHRFSVGTNGATQMPGGAAAGDVSALAGTPGQGLGGVAGSSGALGLLSGAGSLSGASSPSDGLPGLVGQIAQQQGVNPALAQAVAKSESGFNPNAVSPAGAQGIMQLMPSTFNAYSGSTASSAGTPSGAPVQGSVSQPFGPTSYAAEPPLDWNGQHYGHFHTGIDFAAAQGTPIRATMGGTVEIRADPEGYGNLVVVRHGPWDVLYGHTSGQPAGVQTGAQVRAGDVIGYVGSTGNSSGPHVHYELRYRGQIVDPSPFTQGAGAAAGTSGGNAFDPVANAKAGVGYLKDMLNRFKGNVPNALAAYNAGPGAVEKYGGIPPYPETQNYVRQTMQYAHDLGA
jgi:murein DD-endopeptidase MepM/ murein hydrolase activator NlpD